MTSLRLTLDQALKIIGASLENARQQGVKPLSVVVLDAGGHLIAFQRQDGASIMRFDIARGKAAGALALGVSSRTIASMAIERPGFVASLSAMATNGLIPAAGGILIAGENDVVIGAVGITGDTSDNDEACAIEGVKAAGLAVLSR